MPRSLEYCQGYLDSLLATSWTCHDCGNTYDPDTTDCPNRHLDEAQTALRAAKARSNYGPPDDPEDTATLENSAQLLVMTHSPGQCLGEYCTIHNRSDHHMRGWPQNWRPDRRIMERICPHGVGHPDPDEINPDTTHGCDGCCVPPEAKEDPTFSEPDIGTVLMCRKDGDYYYRTAKGWINEYGDGPFTWDQVSRDVEEPVVVLEAPQ